MHYLNEKSNLLNDVCGWDHSLTPITDFLFPPVYFILAVITPPLVIAQSETDNRKRNVSLHVLSIWATHWKCSFSCSSFHLPAKHPAASLTPLCTRNKLVLAAAILKKWFLHLYPLPEMCSEIKVICHVPKCQHFLASRGRVKLHKTSTALKSEEPLWNNQLESKTKNSSFINSLETQHSFFSLSCLFSFLHPPSPPDKTVGKKNKH